MSTVQIEELFISDPKQKREKRGNDFIKNEPSKLSDTVFSQELLAEDGKLLYAICDSAGTDTYDQLAVALLTCFEHRSVPDAMRLLRSSLSREIDKTTDGGTIFRGTTIATKLVSAYCKDKGMDYLREVLRPLLQLLLIDEVSVEVDPVKLDPKENLESNLQMLLMVTKGLTQHVFRAVDDCTMYIYTSFLWLTGFVRGMRALFRIAQEEVKSKFSEQRTIVVGAFYFLRFLCPALVVPDSYGLVNEKPSEKCRRSLILVSKILQNLANNVEFGEKENYMVKTNAFITNNQQAMYEFLDKLADVDVNEILNELEPHVTEEALVNAMDYLTTSVKRMSVKLGKYFGEQNKDYYDKIIGSLDEYNKVAAEVKGNPKPKQQRPVSPPPLCINKKPATTTRPVSPQPTQVRKDSGKKKIVSKEAHLAIWGHYEEKPKPKKEEAEEPEEYEKVIYLDTPTKDKNISDMDKSELAEKQKDLEREIGTLTGQIKDLQREKDRTEESIRAQPGYRIFQNKLIELKLKLETTQQALNRANATLEQVKACLQK